MTIDDCFKTARELFVKNNAQLMNRIQHEAIMYAQNVGLSEEQFCELETNKHFAQYLTNYSDDPTVSVIRLMAPDNTTRKELLLGYYRTVSQHLGISVESYFAMNSISISDL